MAIRDEDALMALLVDPELHRDEAAARPSLARRDLRADLLAASEPGRAPHPFPGFRERFAQLFALDLDAADCCLARIHDPTAFVPFRGLRMYSFRPGRDCAGTHAGLIRVDPGTPFPVHRHRGTETTLMLSGAAQDEETGQVYLPGDVHTMPSGSMHRARILPPHECVFAVLMIGDQPDFE